MRCDYILCAVVVVFVVAVAFVCRVLWSKVKCFENEAEKQEKSRERRQKDRKLGDFCLGFWRFFSYFFRWWRSGVSFDLQWILKQFVGLFPIVIIASLRLCLLIISHTTSPKLLLFLSEAHFLFIWSTHFQVQVTLLWK